MTRLTGVRRSSNRAVRRAHARFSGTLPVPPALILHSL